MSYPQLQQTTARPPFNIIRVAEVELRVPDLSHARHWYVDLLGLIVTEESADALYLRGIEERVHHSLVLRRAAEAAVDHVGYKVSCEEDLDLLARVHAEAGLPVRWLEAGSRPGQGRVLRTQDPNGLVVEFYYEMAPAEWYIQKYHLHRGPGLLRIDHVNNFVPDLQKSFGWWTQTLGFYCSEYTDTDAPDYRLYAAWLHRKPNVHDIALMNGKGPRLHHYAYWLADVHAVVRACDILAAAGYAGSIERGPGRHGLSNAFFLYLRDPAGHRLELYTGDYLTADPDHQPVRWSIEDKRRQTFWGAAAPRVWFEEASVYTGYEGDGLQEVRPATFEARPSHVI